MELGQVFYSIYTNPRDLLFQLSDESGKWGITITLKSRPNLPALIVIGETFETKEVLINFIRDGIFDSILSMFADGFVCRKIKGEVLTREFSEKILQKLSTDKTVITSGELV